MGTRKCKKKANNSYPFMNDKVMDNQDLGNNQNTFREIAGEERTVVDPEETIVNTTTTRHTIRHIRPTNIVNVNRNVYRVENYYPVTEDFVDENVVEHFECGNDPDDSSSCKRMKRSQEKE
ncbi:spore coat protein (plasmid) [Bacillus sp. JZ8]